MSLPKAMTDHNKNNDDLDFEMVSNHPEDKESVTFNDSCELVDTAIEDATNYKKSLASTMDLVISLMKQVEYQEKAAAQAKEELATSGLDILAEVEQLKQKHQMAKEIMIRNVYARKAVLASEMTELQSRASSVLNEGCTSLAVLNKMRKDLDKRMTLALEEKKSADTKKVENELLARKALAYERGQMGMKFVKELRRLEEEAMNNSKLQQFLVDRGHVIDILDGDISEKCQDVNLLKESLNQAAVSSCSQTSSMLVSSTTSSLTNEINEPADSHVDYEVLGKSSGVSPFGIVDSADEHVQPATKNPVQSLDSVTSVVSPKHEMFTKMSNMDLEAQEIDKNLTLGSDLENSHVVSDITQVGRAKSTEGFVTLYETYIEEVALPSAIKSCSNTKSQNRRGNRGNIGKKGKGKNITVNHISREARAPSANESFGSDGNDIRWSVLDPYIPNDESRDPYFGVHE